MNFVRKIACLIVALGAGLIPLAASAQSQPNSIESILIQCVQISAPIGNVALVVEKRAWHTCTSRGK